MSEYQGQFVMMPVKVIDKECVNCELLDIKTGGSPIYDGENKRVGYENTMRCCSLLTCLQYYNRIAKKVQKTETEPETVEPDTEGDGRSTWWYVCEECRTAIEWKDKYCRECGRRIKWTEAKK